MSTIRDEAFRPIGKDLDVIESDMAVIKRDAVELAADMRTIKAALTTLVRDRDGRPAGSCPRASE